MATVFERFTAQNEGEIQLIFKNEADLKKYWQTFDSLFTHIEAAGGLVEQRSNWLLIKRLGVWDLPKGKIEKNESKSKAAIREVEEETGATGLTIIEKLPETRHIYPLKNGDFVLKTTYWYRMQTPENFKLVPQTEEAITEVVWRPISTIDPITLETYASIREVLKNGLKSI